MARSKKSTAVHRTGYADKITEILKDKDLREGFKRYREMINEKFDLDLTTRQVRYFYNNYVKPKEVVTPKEAKDAIEEQRETINVAIEQMDLFEEQRERLRELIDLDPVELQREANRHLTEDDRPKTELSIRGSLASITRQEIELAADILQDIKEMKQDLGLLSKEPERLEIKSEEEVEVDISEFGQDDIRDLAMAMAGVDDRGGNEGKEEKD
ncbi:MAG: hypothetical protein ACLFU5_00785 [Thermoplasmata archaeon]